MASNLSLSDMSRSLGEHLAGCIRLDLDPMAAHVLIKYRVDGVVHADVFPEQDVWDLCDGNYTLAWNCVIEWARQFDAGAIR